MSLEVTRTPIGLCIPQEDEINEPNNTAIKTTDETYEINTSEDVYAEDDGPVPSPNN